MAPPKNEPERLDQLISSTVMGSFNVSKRSMQNPLSATETVPRVRKDAASMTFPAFCAADRPDRPAPSLFKRDNGGHQSVTAANLEKNVAYWEREAELTSTTPFAFTAPAHPALAFAGLAAPNAFATNRLDTPGPILSGSRHGTSARDHKFTASSHSQMEAITRLQKDILLWQTNPAPRPAISPAPNYSAALRRDASGQSDPNHGSGVFPRHNESTDISQSKAAATVRVNKKVSRWTTNPVPRPATSTTSTVFAANRSDRPVPAPAEYGTATGLPKFSLPSPTQAPAPTARMIMNPIPPLEKHEVAPGLLQAMSKRAGVPKAGVIKAGEAKAAVPKTDMAKAGAAEPAMKWFKISSEPALLRTAPRASATPRLQVKSKTRFLDLPDVVRTKIYYFALVDDDPIKLLPRLSFLKQPALLCTCSRIRKETVPIFYSENAFNSRFHHDLRKWLRHLSTTALKLLQCVQLVTPMPAGFVQPSLQELTERIPDGLDAEAVSVPMQVQGEKGWLTWATLSEMDQFENVDGTWRVNGPIRRKSVLKKRKREN